MKLKRFLVLPVFLLFLASCAKTKPNELKDIFNNEIDETILVNEQKGYYVTLTFTNENGSLDMIKVKDDCKFIKSMNDLKEIFTNDDLALEIFKEDLFDNFYIGTAYRENEKKQDINVAYKNLVVDGVNQVSITKMYNGKYDQAIDTYACFDLYLIPKADLKNDSPLFDENANYTYLFNLVLAYN